MITKILVACHKPDIGIRNDQVYMPIQVGKDNHPDIDLGYQCDNTGNNISSKNASYCELTALYWAWKNLKDADVIGLCHYRRYFDFESNISSTREVTPDAISDLKCMSLEKLKLSENEVILPKFWRTSTPIWNVFQENVICEDLYILYKIIESHYPDYLPTFEKYVKGNNRTGFNMFIMPRKWFNEYCEWLFSILNLMEKKAILHPYISYSRLYGYLGEILLPVYCIKNKLKIKEKRLIFTTPLPHSKIIGRRYVANTINNISYKLGKLTDSQIINKEYWDLYLKLDRIVIEDFKDHI